MRPLKIMFTSGDNIIWNQLPIQIGNLESLFTLIQFKEVPTTGDRMSLQSTAEPRSSREHKSIPCSCDGIELMLKFSALQISIASMFHYFVPRKAFQRCHKIFYYKEVS